MSRDPHQLLRIYVRDHHAAAVAGVALIQRCARNNADTDYEAELVELAEAIADDRRSLEQVMDGWLHVSASLVRVTAARTGELLARFKANGRVITYSPLSRVVELEALVAGVTSKRQLWRCLAVVAAHDVTLADPVAAARFSALEAGAALQLDRLVDLHRQATDVAFVGGGMASN